MRSSRLDGPRGASAWASESFADWPCTRPDETIRMVAHGSLGRILKSTDFAAVLSRPSTARTIHFALHYVSASPAVLARTLKARDSVLLSTGNAESVDRPVDILCRTSGAACVAKPVAMQVLQETTARPTSATDPVGVWIGLVVPKRHARRSVTRTLIKRQIRMAFENAGKALRPGMWVVRLKAPFDKSDYPSAASTALMSAVREELAALVMQGGRQRDRTS